MRLEPETLARFLQQLDDQYGFDISIRERLRAEQVRRLLLDAPAGFDVDDWASHLAPVVCGSLEEQRTLRLALRRFVKQPADIVPPLGEPGNTTLGASGPPPTQWIRHLLIVTTLGIVFVLLLVITAGSTLGPQIDFEPLQTAMRPILETVDSFERGLRIMLPFVAFSLFGWGRYDRKLAIFQQNAYKLGLPARRFGSDATLYFPPAQVARHLHAFKTRWPMSSAWFGAAATIRAAARRAGYAEPQFRQRSMAPTYILLVSQRGRADHITAAGIELGRLLRSAAVEVATYLYFGEPAYVAPTDLEAADPSPQYSPIDLATVLDQAPDAAIIVVEDGAGLFDPLALDLTVAAAAILERRRLAVLMSPLITSNWGPRERALELAGFLVLPCDAAGIGEMARAVSDLQGDNVQRLDPLVHAAERNPARSVAGRFPPLLRTGGDRFLRSRHPPDSAEIDRLIDELKHYLGKDGFEWLAALAIYPVLQAPLTREIGVRMAGLPGGTGFDAQLYLALARLPWLAQSRMPNWLREALVAQLTAEKQATVRRIMVELFATPRPQGDIIVEFDQPGVMRRLRSLFEPPSSLDQPRRDALFARFMSHRSGTLFAPAQSLLDFTAGQRWRERGYYAVALAAALLLSAVGWVVPHDDSSPLSTHVLLAVCAIGLLHWQAIRSHWADDVVSRSTLMLGFIGVALAVAYSTLTSMGAEAWFLSLAFVAALTGRWAIQSQRLEAAREVHNEAADHLRRAPMLTVFAIMVLPAVVTYISAVVIDIRRGSTLPGDVDLIIGVVAIGASLTLIGLTTIRAGMRWTIACGVLISITLFTIVFMAWPFALMVFIHDKVSNLDIRWLFGVLPFGFCVSAAMGLVLLSRRFGVYVRFWQSLIILLAGSMPILIIIVQEYPPRDEDWLFLFVFSGGWLPLMICTLLASTSGSMGSRQFIVSIVPVPALFVLCAGLWVGTGGPEMPMALYLLGLPVLLWLALQPARGRASADRHFAGSRRPGPVNR